jgi:putative transposase
VLCVISSPVAGKDIALCVAMPREILERSDRFPYHVTARTNNREIFPIEMSQAWEIVRNEALFLSFIYRVEIHALVLMPNHFHLLITVPEKDLGKVMNEFMKSVSRTVNLKSGRSGHLFGGSYHRTLIKGSRYFGHALKYVYRNPVKASLCEKVEDYPYSSLYGLIGSDFLLFPVHFTRVGMDIGLPLEDFQEMLDWLNTSFPKDAEVLIQKGLRKRVFEHMKTLKSRRPARVLDSLI